MSFLSTGNPLKWMNVLGSGLEKVKSKRKDAKCILNTLTCLASPCLSPGMNKHLTVTTLIVYGI